MRSSRACAGRSAADAPAARRADRGSSPERLHDWRRRVTELRHQAELLRAVDAKRLRRTARLAHELADLLGEDHDLAELARLAPAGGSLAAAAALRRAQLRGDAVALGARLHERAPRRLERRLRRRIRRRTGWS